METNYKHIVLQFDQAQQPKYVEKRGKYIYIEYGKNNDYPEYLLSLYNESPKHGAIIKSKCTYVYGKGFEVAGMANSRGETWNQIVKKCIKDDELYRGYYLQVIWNRIGQIAEVYHIDFAKVRVNKDLNCYYVKNDWKDMREKPREYPAFDVNNKYGSQIYYCKEYNPSSEVYPLPSYFQGLNYIESDIEVSRHILGNAKQGFVGSTLINLNNGDPINEEHKGEVERGLLKKFTGDSGKRVVIMFNKSKDNAAEIVNLGQTMLTKEDFTNINNLIQQEIFAAHQIVSPTLMGIKTEGQLGGRNEIREAYEIFNNTYVQERQAEFNSIFTEFRNLKGEAGEFKLVPVEPLKFEFSESIMAANLTQNEIRALMGKEPLQTNEVTADGSAALPTQPLTAVESNEAIKNLSGRQYQNVMRIVRQFGNGKLSKAQATLMLKNGFGFSDADVDTFLGIDENPLTDDEINKFSLTDDEREYLEFEQFGEEKKKYIEVPRDDYKMYFADELNQAQADVLGLIEKDQNIVPEVIARLLRLDVDLVEDIIATFISLGILQIAKSKINQNPVYEVLKPLGELEGKKSKVTKLFIRYSYVGPRDNRNRRFCIKMLELSEKKTWSRSDIEQISERLGYSVWDRRGGWYNINGESRPYCRHRWQSKLMRKIDE